MYIIVGMYSYVLYLAKKKKILCIVCFLKRHQLEIFCTLPKIKESQPPIFSIIRRNKIYSTKGLLKRGGVCR